MSTKHAVCFRHQYRDRKEQFRYWDGSTWFGGFNRAHDFGSHETAQAFVAAESKGWETESKWLGQCDPPFVTTKEEQLD